MDTDFQIVGIRNIEDQTVSRHKKWYQGKPLISAMLLAVILSGCLCCHLIMTKDPGYMDLAHYNEAPGGEFLFGTDTMGRYFFHDLVWGTDIPIDRSACNAYLYGTCNCLWCSQRMCTGMGGFTAHALYRDFLKYPESAAGYFIAGSLRKSQHFQYFIYYRDHKLARYCQSGAHRSKTDPKQRVCHRSKMYGRKLLACLVETPDSQFCFIDHVYGCHEYQKRDHCRVNLKLHGNRAAVRADFVGKHAFKCRQSTDDKVMVDHPHTGSFSYSHAHVHDKSWKLFEKSCQPEGKLSVTVSVHT